MILSYGIIGSGMMGCEHIRNLKKIPGANVVAIADPDEKSRKRARKICGDSFHPTFYEDHKTLLLDEKIDVVVVSTPNFTHIEVMRDIFGTDKHVLLEKPMCTNLADGIEVLERSKAHKGLVWVGLEYRFMSPIQAIIKHLDKVGDIKMLSIREHRFPFLKKVGDWNRFNEKTGGTLVEKCCHFFDLMNLMIESNPIKVYASGSQAVNHLDEAYGGRTPDILDNSYVIVDYEMGERAMLELCMFAEGGRYEQEIVVTGDKGKIETHIPSEELLISNREKNSFESLPIKNDSRVREEGLHHGASYIEHLELMDCLTQGKSAKVDCRNGLESMILGLAAQESIKTGEPIYLSEFLRN